MDGRVRAAVSLSLFMEEGHLLCPSPSVDRIRLTGSPRGTGSVWGTGAPRTRGCGVPKVYGG